LTTAIIFSTNTLPTPFKLNEIDYQPIFTLNVVLPTSQLMLRSQTTADSMILIRKSISDIKDMWNKFSSFGLVLKEENGFGLRCVTVNLFSLRRYISATCLHNDLATYLILRMILLIDKDWTNCDIGFRFFQMQRIPNLTFGSKF
jgi:hypothetical protein